VKPYTDPYLTDPTIAQTYDVRVGERWDNRDIALYLGLAEEAAGPVLELACGTGRVLLPLARAGHQVTGLDLSPHMLAEARRKLAAEPPEVQARANLIEGTMCRFDLARRFALILIPFRAFQALLTREEQRGCLECCREHLLPEGRLVLDVFNPRLSRLTQGSVQEEAFEATADDGKRLRFSAETSYDQSLQMLSSLGRTEALAADGAAVLNDGELRLRYFFRSEVEWMLEACGLEVETIYGDFAQSPFTADSGEIIAVARRRDR
jgi:SAM-dependent methyltransferase